MSVLFHSVERCDRRDLHHACRICLQGSRQQYQSAGKPDSSLEVSLNEIHFFRRMLFEDCCLRISHFVRAEQCWDENSIEDREGWRILCWIQGFLDFGQSKQIRLDWPTKHPVRFLRSHPKSDGIYPSGFLYILFRKAWWNNYGLIEIHMKKSQGFAEKHMICIYPSCENVRYLYTFHKGWQGTLFIHVERFV